MDLKLNSRLTVRLNLAYIKNDYSDPISSYASGISETGDPNSAASSDQIIRQLNRIAPWIVGRAEDGTYGTIGDGNPLAWLDVNQTVDRKNQNFSGTLSADYKIIDGLVATVTVLMLIINNTIVHFKNIFSTIRIRKQNRIVWKNVLPVGIVQTLMHC